MATLARKHGPTPRVSTERPATAPRAPVPGGLTGRIAARAYEIYLFRTARSTDPVSDWAAAEREIMRAMPASDGDARANACVGMHQRIQRRAFELSKQRDGDATSDWIQAEQEVLAADAGGDADRARSRRPDGTIVEALGRARGEALLASEGD